MTELELPKRRNRREGLERFAEKLKELSTQVGFRVSARGWCLPPETLINTNKGVVSADKVKTGDIVLTKNENGDLIEWKEVLEIHQRNFSGKLIEIRPYNLHPLTTTPEHPILVATIQTFQKGGKHRKIVKIEWTQAKNIKVSPSTFRRERSALCYLINREIVDIPDLDKGLCRLMGYYLAEGSIIRTNRPNKTPRAIEFSLNITENQFANDIKKLARRYFNANTTFTDRKEQGGKRVLVYSAKLARFMLEHCGEYASKKRLSPTAMLLPPKKQLEIFLGFVKGDGEIKGNKKLAYTTSKVLALQLHQICLRNNKIASCFFRTDNGVGNNLPLYTIDQTSSSRHVGILKENLLFAPIRGIKQVPYSGIVYNFEVNGNQNYCAEGMLVHNCYQLEGFGLVNKGQFDRVENIVNECREKGYLPIDFTAEEEGRKFSGVEIPERVSPVEYMEQYLKASLECEDWFTPDWWDGEKYYIQMVVEKIDLKTLFTSICRKYHLPIATSKGWSSMLMRAEYARRFKEAEAKGLTCVLLYCGDFDPDGLRISDFLLKNLEDLKEITWNDGTDGYDPSNLMIDRFGLNYDFIVANKLTWIDGLITGSGKDLASPSHPNHHLPYIQEYLHKFGAKKCEANALVIRPDQARELCRETIEKYLGKNALGRFNAKREAVRKELRKFRKDTGLDMAIKTALKLIKKKKEE